VYITVGTLGTCVYVYIHSMLIYPTIELCSSIVNQMLWSKQLELPTPQGSVVKRPPNKLRSRAASLMRRESYSTMYVIHFHNLKLTFTTYL